MLFGGGGKARERMSHDHAITIAAITAATRRATVPNCGTTVATVIGGVATAIDGVT